MAQMTLTQAREAKGYSVDDVAFILDQSPRLITALEIDSTDIRFGLFMRLAKLYQTTMDDIYLGDTTKDL